MATNTDFARTHSCPTQYGLIGSQLSNVYDETVDVGNGEFPSVSVLGCL